MATTILETAQAKVRIDHYLENFSYRPDVEFVDGELRERPIAGSTHGLLRSNIWLIDPERRACEMYGHGAWVDAMRLEVQGSPIYVDRAEIFAILDADDTESPSAPLP